MTAGDFPIPAGAVQLRRLSPNDITPFLAYRSDPDVARYQSWEPMEESEALDFLTFAERADVPQPGSWRQIGIADDTNALIGDMGLWLSADSQIAEIGVTLAKGAQGKGWSVPALEAAAGFMLTVPDLTIIKGIADTRNAASIAMLKRAGFTYIETIECEENGENFTEAIHHLRRA